MYPEAVKDRRNSGTGPWPGNLTHAWRAGTAKGYGSSGAEDTRQTFLLCSNAGGVVKSCTSDVVWCVREGISIPQLCRGFPPSKRHVSLVNPRESSWYTVPNHREVVWFCVWAFARLL